MTHWRKSEPQETDDRALIWVLVTIAVLSILAVGFSCG